MLNILLIAFDTAVVVCLFLMRSWMSRLDRDLYSTFANYANKIESVSETQEWLMNDDIEPMEKSIEETNKRVDALEKKFGALKKTVDEIDVTPEENFDNELIRGLENIFKYSGGSN